MPKKNNDYIVPKLSKRPLSGRRTRSHSPRPSLVANFLSNFRFLFLGTLVLITSACTNQAEDVLIAGGFSGLGAATDVAQAKGLLRHEGIVLEFDSVDSSEELMTKFISGEYDIIQTNADNIIAWAEGQGMDKQVHDFVIVMGGYRGRQPMELVVAKDISSAADLQGKVLAVDAINTGYAPMLVYMLKQEGLVWKEDYQLKSVGGGPMRVDSMLRGETVGGLVSLDDDLEQKGFHRLMTSRDYITNYARAVTTVRPEWAAQNEDLLVRYIRAMVRAINWLLNPQNRSEAIGIIMAAEQVSETEAQQIYAEAVDPTFGFIADAGIEADGVEQILEIREVMGEMQVPLPSPDKYIERRFYDQAISSLARQDRYQGD